MNGLGKLGHLVKSNVWMLAAFFVPLAIRAIPEVLSWPYLLGFDTLTSVNLVQSGHVFTNSVGVLGYQLFYSVATVVNGLFGNSIITLKVFGPVLMGLVALMMFLYAKRVLDWSSFKSFFVAFLLGFYFVTLRNSWDLYAQSFALVFLFATLITLRLSKSNWRFPVALVFVLLTVWSHELVSFILFFILLADGLRSLPKGLSSESIFSFVSIGLGSAFFLFRHYSPSAGGISLPGVAMAPVASFDRALHMAGLVLFCFGLLLPFVIAGLRGLKDWKMGFWALLCVGIVILSMVLPDNPFYYWNRWVYLLVYPLLFFAVKGLDMLWKRGSAHVGTLWRIAPKLMAVIYVALLVALSGFYIAAAPESQISIFSSNSFLSYIPSSMLQNTLPLRDNPSFVACSNWIKDNAPSDYVLVEHYALYDLARIYIKGRVITVENVPSIWMGIQNEASLVDKLVSSCRQALDDGNSTVYTIWWAPGEGWYKIPSLPGNFTDVYQVDRMAVYVFER